METEQPTTNRRDYNREYQNKRYNADKEKARMYQQSIKLKSKLGIKDDVWDKYKHYLADVVRLTAIVEHLPKELILEIVKNPPKIVPKETQEDKK